MAWPKTDTAYGVAHGLSRALDGSCPTSPANTLANIGSAAQAAGSRSSSAAIAGAIATR